MKQYTRIKGFNVYRNDRFIKFIEGRSHRRAKEFIRDGEVSIGTHMGQWRRTSTIRPEGNGKQTCYEFEYSTTVGAYIKFSPAFTDRECCYK